MKFDREEKDAILYIKKNALRDKNSKKKLTDREAVRLALLVYSKFLKEKDKPKIIGAKDLKGMR